MEIVKTLARDETAALMVNLWPRMCPAPADAKQHLDRARAQRDTLYVLCGDGPDGRARPLPDGRWELTAELGDDEDFTREQQAAFEIAVGDLRS